jgi:hypothetical protein
MVLTRSSLNKLQAETSVLPTYSTSQVTKSRSSDRARTRNTRVTIVEDDSSFDSNRNRNQNQNQSVSSSSSRTSSRTRSGGSASVFTSSARKAALSNHKIYAPSGVTRRSSRVRAPRDILTYEHEETPVAVVDQDDEDYYVEEQFEGGDYDDYEEACDTAEILASLSSSSSSSSSSSCQQEEKQLISPMERCLNPVSSQMCYVYNLIVSDPTGQQPYSSSYILYNMKNSSYYLLNKITLVSESQPQQENIEPSTPYFLQTKYSSYMRDSVEKYIRNLLVFRHIPQSIETRFIGLVTSKQTIDTIFNSDGCYYDVDALFKSKSSSETLSGNELFILTPSIYYSNTTFAENIQDILTILSGQQ